MIFLADVAKQMVLAKFQGCEVVPLAALASAQGAHVPQGDQGALPTCSCWCSRAGEKIQLHRHLSSFPLVKFYRYNIEKKICIFSNLVAGVAF